MEFLDKRVQVICDELKREAVRLTLPIHDWRCKKGFFLTPCEAKADASAFEPFDSAHMHWYGPDCHYWFTAETRVPEEFDGKPLWLKVLTQIDEWDDGRNPQFLLFVNGEVVQGLDMYHREVFITKSAVAGEKLALDLQAYSGTLHGELSLIVEFREIDPEIEGLYWDLQVPLQAFPRLDKESASRLALQRVLNEAVNLLDLRRPYSPEYMTSILSAREYLAERLYGELCGHDEVIASCVGHTHIDVAWWWTVEQTREKVARSFATVLKLMDEYPRYVFMSSQPQLYQFLKERYPGLYARVKKRVAEGRWEPEGGMWVEADCNLTSGESLVRQFIHGERFFKEEFGKDCRVLWLPDVFGYSAALPQIMKLCGIKYFMTTKLTWNQFNKIPCDTFLWRGIDGSEILTHFITTLDIGQPLDMYITTYNGKLHPDALIGGWQRYQQKEINNDILSSYGYGDGGGGPTRMMLETDMRLKDGVTGIPKVRQVGSRQYFEELDARVRGNKRLPTWEGELYFEYHRGTLSSMGRNKRGNRKSEIGMMDLELISTLAADKIDYPREKLDQMWKTILLNQFHDILPGSAIHEVYEVTKRDYEVLEEKTREMEDERLRLLFEPGERLSVLNVKGFDSDEVVNINGLAEGSLKDGAGNIYPIQQTRSGGVAWLGKLPSKGWQSYQVIPEQSAENPFELKDGALETPFYTVGFDSAAFITRLYDKENDREALKVGQRANLMRMYEDKPANYDNWDIDIFYTEKSWDATDLTNMSWTEFGPVRATLEIERRISNSVIRQKIRFYAKSRRIDFETNVDWREHQHLLKVHFPTNVHSDEAAFDIQFGSLTRKIHKNTSWDVARFESCAHKWMDFSEGHYGVSLLNDCKYGHSVDDGVIALTLIKSGIEPNPTADQEQHVFTYALYPHAGGWREGGTVREAYRLNQPSRAVAGANEIERYSLCGTDKPNVMIETVKRAEDGDGWIIRMYETDNALTKCEVYWNRPVKSAEECDCTENLIREIGKESRFPLTLNPFEIKTIRVRENNR